MRNHDFTGSVDNWLTKNVPALLSEKEKIIELTFSIKDRSNADYEKMKMTISDNLDVKFDANSMKDLDYCSFDILFSESRQ